MKASRNGTSHATACSNNVRGSLSCPALYDETENARGKPPFPQLQRLDRLCTVPPGTFRPVPGVDSAVARLVPLGAAKPRIDDVALLSLGVAAAFGQRRKTLRNALSAPCDAPALEAASADPAARGETPAVADFVRLASALAGRK